MSGLKTQIVRMDCVAQTLALLLAVCGQQMNCSVPQFPLCEWSMVTTLTSLGCQEE